MLPRFCVGELSPAARQEIAREVRALCRRRRTAAASRGGRRELNPQLVAALEQRILHAASYAAIGPIPNKIARRGYPPNNARPILARDIQQALTDLGLSGGTRFADPQSLAVELYNVVAERVWTYSNGSPFNPRSTFCRMKAANISN